ncbi:MAG TPA: C4-type zinc ribbon domain-containing protein [bacterium]|nr:C4-type zinc ribbon domain-containing protein [bacterium]
MTLTETLQKLVELQTTDSGRDQLEKHRQALLDKLDLEAARIAALKKQSLEDKKAAEDFAKQRKTLEIEVGSLETRLKRYQSQLDEVKNEKEYEALKQEIEKHKQDKTRLEEKVLEILFQEDAQKEKIAVLAGQITADEKRYAEDQKEIGLQVADCEKAMAEKMAERQVHLAALPPEEAQGYEALRQRGKKIAVAAVLENHTCGGCHMAVAPQLLMEVKNGRKINRCDCGRYLYLPAQ